jgi:transglutaminase-like putative cysteine protease
MTSDVVQYTVRHVTRFTYETPISESVMEVRMQPRSEGPQRCLHFGLSTAPASRVMLHQDHEGNIVHHFNIPGRHSRLTVTAEALVEYAPPPDVPEALVDGAWERLDRLTASGEYWDLMNPSVFARSTPLLDALASEISLDRGRNPLETVRRITAEMYERFEYKQESTHVDSPIDDALQTRSGVCQDFAHVTIALVRRLGVPCRYVSGYLFREEHSSDRSVDGATHAWVEALMPDIGWVGFDPTNNLTARDRHIRVAVGRDYADVPPTRGVYKGITAVRSELAVAVRVGSLRPAGGTDVLPFVPWMSREAGAPLGDVDEAGTSSQQ